jgi:hypothetical protein
MKLESSEKGQILRGIGVNRGKPIYTDSSRSFLTGDESRMTVNAKTPRGWNVKEIRALASTSMTSITDDVIIARNSVTFGLRTSRRFMQV